MAEESGGRMPFWSHIAELRRRVLISVAAVLMGFGIAYHYSEGIFRFLVLPFSDAYLKVYGKAPIMITTGLVESFWVYMKVGLLAGVFLASPVILWEIWGFVSPGLHPRERKHAVTVVGLASVFFIGGAIFGYLAVFPVGFRYFLEINGGGTIQPMIRMREYYDLSSMMLLIFGCIFEAPLLVMLLTVLGIVRARHLTKPWRGIVVGIAVAAAVFSPPDPGSMIMVGVPMLLLYGVTVLFALVFQRRKAADASAGG